MLATKAREEQRALSQINSGGLESMKMSTGQSKTTESVTQWRGGGKSPYGPNDGNSPPLAGPS